MRRALTIALVGLALGACANKSDTAEPPAPLVSFEPSLEVDRVWRASVGSAGEEIKLGLAPASDGQRVYVADHQGLVSAYALADGQRLWRTDVLLPLSAGPGVGQGMVVVGGSDGQLIALDADSGERLWINDVDGEILAAPAITRDRVLVTTTAGVIFGLDASNGRDVWRIDHEVPAISLRGTSGVRVVGDRGLVGMDSGKVIAFRIPDGRVIWETAVTIPRGATTIDRIVDVDGTPTVVGTDVFAVSYQGRAVMLGLESGQAFWSQEADSPNPVAADTLGLYLVESTGVIRRLDRRSGTPRWEQSALRARNVVGPALHGQHLAVGDLEGILHWVDRNDGRLLARRDAGTGPVLGPLLVVGELLIVQTRGGDLSAYRIGEG